jgi:pyruvate-ferredoxin/flavodoxin oxidoreductase
MNQRRTITLDANEAAASVAYRSNEVIVIYPITPSSPMGEWCDEWSAHGRPNVWDAVPEVTQMQSEAGAIAAVHGALQAGSLATTFTASQGLLLMIPNLYKIAGELTSFCLHVAARAVATHALSIFGDQSDVMACRQIGLALLCSNSVQEAHDFALIGQAATLRARVPFLHFFDGFRTSHEVAKIEELTDDDLRALLDEDLIAAHRRRALTPDHPVIRGTAQNPDAFFQAREACNLAYQAVPGIVQEVMDQFARQTGRPYRLFEYVGHPEADRVMVLMGSGAETAEETVEYLNARGAKLGLVKVRLYRPFSIKDFMAALPPTTRAVAVLDRTKEPGAIGEPLYLDVVAALREAFDEGSAGPGRELHVIGGRYGLSSKEFTPAMVKAVFEELAKQHPKRHFTVGIVDDVTHLSLPVDPDFDIEPDDVVRAVCYGLGADGTVGANKNSIKIIGEETAHYAQGYFVYDSKKSGAMTVSHLRFGPRPIRSAYQVRSANFVACHQFGFLEKFDVLEMARPGGVFLLNAPYGPEEVWDHLPRQVQEQLLDKQLTFYVIDALQVAKDTGMGGRINTIMQTCFFAVSGALPRDEAIAQIKKSIEKTYSKKGEEVVRRNFAAVDQTLSHLHAVPLPDRVTARLGRPPVVAADAPDLVKKLNAVLIAGKGDLLPVSAFPVDGTWPTGTARWEKRTIATEVPIWDPKVCIQCNKCAFVCPHAAIRAKVFEPSCLAAPAGYQAVDFKAAEYKGWKYTIQVAPQDCTGCNLCVMICPAKDKSNPRHKAINMEPLSPVLPREKDNYAFFLGLPDPPRERVHHLDVKGSQFFRPLFEYSGACAGCGETPYLKLLTQLFGDRVLIANATGCSSIYGGNLPTTPYTTDACGRGPAWSNSLFEDTAEFGLGFRLSIDHLHRQAVALLMQLGTEVGDPLVRQILSADQSSEAGIAAQRRRVATLQEKLTGITGAAARRLELLADYLVQKSVWLIGGDGWAYDIGFGGLDHVLSLGRKVNLLVLDTEVYSNTGGQASKSTPLGAAAKFATAGKSIAKKDLGLMAMSYGHVYVASVAFGAKDSHTVQAFQEAESYEGPSLIIAYSPCIAHGYDLRYGAEQQKLAVNSGVWPLYRYDPRRVAQGLPPLVLDAPAGKASVQEYMRNETRFRMVEKVDPVRFRELAVAARDQAARRVALYQQLAHITLPQSNGQPAASPGARQAPAHTSTGG